MQDLRRPAERYAPDLKNSHEQPIIAYVAPRKKPIALIVRRGAIRRFHKLKEKTADLPVEVLWDRRESDRHAAADKEGAKRRSADRRQPPPFTWDVSDFVVAAKPQKRKKKA